MHTLTYGNKTPCEKMCVKRLDFKQQEYRVGRRDDCIRKNFVENLRIFRGEYLYNIQFQTQKN